jgi:hypothetical protein
MLYGNCYTCFGLYLHPLSGAHTTVSTASDICQTVTTTCCDVSEDPTVFNVHRSVHSKNILIYIQQDATLHSLCYMETALHVSGGTSTHHQERIQLYLQHRTVTATCRYRGR